MRFYNCRRLDGELFEFSVPSADVQHPRRDVGRNYPHSSASEGNSYLGAFASEGDLEGGYVLPAFVDCHCHILPAGLDLQRLNLSACSTREETLATLRECRTDAEWLLAVQYDHNRFPDGVHVSASDLDAITQKPTVLRHSSGHACVANTAAMQAAGVLIAEDPPGGEIVRDESGAPTGVLLETAMELVYSAVPKPGRYEMVEAIRAAARDMNRLGITAAADMMTGYYNLEDELWAYGQCDTLRPYLYVQWDEMHRLDVPVAGIKLFSDGAIGAATAAMHEEYEDGGNGMLIYEPEELKRRVKIAHDAGYSVAIHAIGDRATDVVLDAIEATGEPQRHRVEHVMVLSDSQIERIKRSGVRVTLQPEFLTRFENTYMRRLGERAKTLIRARSILDAGIPTGFSSDRPIVPGNPWDGIRAAVGREQEAVTAEEAIDCYTRGAARLCGDAEDHGDFQVYYEDPSTMDRKPDRVFFGGVELT